MNQDHPLLRLILTADGSRTLYQPGIGEAYHSTKGALSESRHVFIRHGLDDYHTVHQPDKICILEIGMGTGLNALLSLEYARHHQVGIDYVGLEPFPVPASVLYELGFETLFNDHSLSVAFYAMHQCESGNPVWIAPYFSITKEESKIEDFIPDRKFDIIYLDAFSPRNAVTIWTPDVFEKLFQSLNHHGVLVTYCAKGQVKRDLRAAGFDVGTLPGANGKREMIRAVKTNETPIMI